jgi:hypothetical protein
MDRRRFLLTSLTGTFIQPDAAAAHHTPTNPRKGYLTGKHPPHAHQAEV